jgi:steroid delta-isomerase-like uncharacterized protein
VRRFYDDLWNTFDVSVADEILSSDVVFRGTMKHGENDLAGFKDYVHEIQAAFPDFYQRIDEQWVDGDTCIARMYWTGTHRGEYRGHAATGREFAYPGAAVFRFADGLITDVWAVGDTQSLWSAIS